MPFKKFGSAAAAMQLYQQEWDSLPDVNRAKAFNCNCWLVFFSELHECVCVCVSHSKMVCTHTHTRLCLCTQKAASIFFIFHLLIPVCNGWLLLCFLVLYCSFPFIFPLCVLCRSTNSSSSFSFYFIRPVVHTALDFNVSIKSDASARCYHCRRRWHCRLIVIIVTCILAIYSRKFHVCTYVCVWVCYTFNFPSFL